MTKRTQDTRPWYTAIIHTDGTGFPTGEPGRFTEHHVQRVRAENRGQARVKALVAFWKRQEHYSSDDVECSDVVALMPGRIAMLPTKWKTDVAEDMANREIMQALFPERFQEDGK